METIKRHQFSSDLKSPVCVPTVRRKTNNNENHRKRKDCICQDWDGFPYKDGFVHPLHFQLRVFWNTFHRMKTCDHNPLEIICSSVISMGPAGSEQIAPENSRFAAQHLYHHALKRSELPADLRSDSNTFAIFGLKLYDLVARNDRDGIPAPCHILVQWHCKKIDDKPACCM